MGAKRHRLNAGRPSAGRRPRKKRYLVVTNGEVTEPQYFRGLEIELGNVVIDVRTDHRDPSGLAALASDLKKRETASNRSTGGRSGDGFQQVFVVTDVDEFTAAQFQEARRTCKKAGIELVICNPCFEVWLIDHLMSCPETFSETKVVANKALDLGIVGGSRGKHINYGIIEGLRQQACKNATAHNSEERSRIRKQLNDMSFAPWTDMPSVIERLDGSGNS